MKTKFTLLLLALAFVACKKEEPTPSETRVDETPTISCDCGIITHKQSGFTYWEVGAKNACSQGFIWISITHDEYLFTQIGDTICVGHSW